MLQIFKTFKRSNGRISVVKGFHSGMTYPFKMPITIERSPTDLLQALSSTVKRDETAPQFMFIDDPFTIPNNSTQRKRYILSKEFGRRTAIRFVEEWPTLFMFDRDHPRLAAFRPEKPPDPRNFGPNEMDLALTNLTKMIENRQVKNALELYNKMKGQDIPNNVKMSLYRLLCYYNEMDPPITEFEWPANRVYGTDLHKPPEEYSKWNANKEKPSLAEELFEELPKNDETYSFLICGLLKFPTEYSLKKAVELYQQMKAEGCVPFEELFNYMIKTRRPLKNEQPFKLREWLKEMKRLQILPSIKTFNSCFLRIFDDATTNVEVGSQVNNSNLPKQSQIKKIQFNAALELMKEMNHHEIEPSLSIYWKVLDLASDNIKYKLSILGEILGRLEEKLEKDEEILFTDPQDHIFFYTSVGICSMAQNLVVFDRVMNVYNHRNNQVKIQNPWDETIFYQNYLLSKLYYLSLDAFLIIYKKFIPNVASIGITFARAIYFEMESRKPKEFSWKLLKRLTEDCISAALIYNSQFAHIVLEHFRDIRPSYHLSEPDAKEYFILCERLIHVLELIAQQREEFKQRDMKRAEKLHAAKK